MKKWLSLALVALLGLAVLSGCGGEAELKKIKVGASITPHAEILAVANEVLKEKG